MKSKNTVYLNGHEDWEEWSLMIESIALEKGLWNSYLKTDLREDQIVRIQEPEIPDVSNMSAVEQSMANKRFHIQMDQYNRKTKNLETIYSVLRSTISRKFLYILRGKQDLREAYLALQTRLGVTKFYISSVINGQWRRQRSGWPKGVKFDQWLLTWDNIFHRGKEKDIPEFRDDQVKISEFLFAVFNYQPYLADKLLGKQEEGETLQFDQVIKKFRLHSLHRAAEAQLMKEL